MEKSEEMHSRKTVIITGANSGIGKAASLLFASHGHRVIMACRDAKRGEKARDEIVRASGSDGVELALLDVSSKASIDRFSEGFLQSNNVLDVLIHNAAYVRHGAPFCQSDNGTEITFATNVAGPVYLTRKLIASLERSEDARVLHAGSNIIKHFFDDKLVIDPRTIAGEGMDVKRYRGVTGCLFNHRLQEMQPGMEHPGVAEQLRQVAGAVRYPRHALDKAVWGALLQRCTMWASGKAASVNESEQSTTKRQAV